MKYDENDFEKSSKSFMNDSGAENYKWVRENPVQASQLLWRAIGIIKKEMEKDWMEECETCYNEIKDQNIELIKCINELEKRIEDLTRALGET